MPTHNIPHVWSLKRCKNPNKSKCMICNGSMSFLSTFEKCRSCKVGVHSECRPRVPDNCGLTAKHFKELLTHMVISSSQDTWAPSIGTSKSLNDMPIIQYTDPPTPTVADSSSSTNSSAPSTPAAINGTTLVPTISVHPPQPTSMDRLMAPPRTADLPSRTKQFTFPELSTMTDSDGESAKSSISNGSTVFSGSHKWERRSWNMWTIRHGNTWRELSIPFREIKVEQLIGRGSFGDVYQIEHFGLAAIKFLHMEHIEEEKRLEIFKQETACFQNARHENLVFFCGYVLDSGKYGLVMERIRGPSLHSILHEAPAKDGIEFNDAVDYAKQICQAVSYLHARNIIHKDLRTKNIFIENRKIIITDFGLLNVKRLLSLKKNNGFVFPQNWLAYQAPENIRCLSDQLDGFHFNEKTDLFAFGTIWYELLTRKYPFEGVELQTVIWNVGFGMKSSIGKLNVNRDAKMLLMQCWSTTPSDRKSFNDVLEKLEALPRKTIRRSPSFPAYKSFEAIY
ncbi:hypothetical protein M3Y98_00298100 [Aphelenchoides besseyi]|nr:hypothetical protein M3Y98_00298100 [Aphelenchoides besseyi]KAI6201196.1 hypothetical protein M3Y96_00816100 [Aphelenchoides besseyi]